jgi:hypothetical protein
MANEVFKGKGSYRIQSFLRAQFCFHLKPFRKPHHLTRQGEGFDFLPPHSSSNEEKEEVASIPPVERLASCEDRTVFVASHFASLDPTNSFAGKRVPYLSAEDDSWPQAFREIEGVYWGHLSRTTDCERIDLKIITAQSTHPEISGECKNYSNPLSGDVLREILERIPKTSWLHLVICTHLQADCWTKQTKVKWEDFRARHGLGESAILRVVKQGSRIALQPLFPGSVPQTPATKLVIFFPFADWMLKKAEKSRKRGTIES